MRTRARTFLLARRLAGSSLPCFSALWLGACDATVVLGTECPAQPGACTPQDAAAPKDDAKGELDAEPARDAAEETPDADAAPEPPDAAEAPDAAEESDAEVDAGPTLFPPFQNPSFELLDGGVTGPLAAFEMPSPIAPWYVCRTGLSVLSSAPAGAETVTPTHDDTFLSDSFPIVALNLNGVNQDFDPPLRAGQRYAFMIDLWGQSGLSGGNLALEVASGNCVLPVTHLTSTELLPNGGWESQCVRFVPPRDVASLVLMVTAPEEYLNIGARLYLDNIRSDPTCY